MTPEKKLDQKDITAFRREFEELETEISRAVIGYRDLIRFVLIAFFSDGHVLLEGVPGVGKTHLIKTLARASGLTFSRIQFTPDLMPADIVGTELLLEDPAGGRRMVFRPGPIFTNILLADEINRAMPKTQSALLEGMAEHQVTAGGNTRPLSPPFFVLATQNPLEMEGTYPLPEAQIDRFFFKLTVPYPGKEDLSAIIDLTTGTTAYEAAVRPAPGRAVIRSWWAGESGKEEDPVEETLTDQQKKQMATLRRSRIAYLKEVVRGVLIDPAAREYLLRIIMATHEESARKKTRWFGRQETEEANTRRFIEYGASPRGAQAMILAAKTLALLDDRPIIRPEDIRAVTLPALRHRLILNFEAEAEDRSPDDLLNHILEKTPIG
jgi:MoxR-like ATPase